MARYWFGSRSSSCVLITTSDTFSPADRYKSNLKSSLSLTFPPLLLHKSVNYSMKTFESIAESVKQKKQKNKKWECAHGKRIDGIQCRLTLPITITLTLLPGSIFRLFWRLLCFSFPGFRSPVQWLLRVGPTIRWTLWTARIEWCGMLAVVRTTSTANEQNDHNDTDHDDCHGGNENAQ